MTVGFREPGHTIRADVYVFVLQIITCDFCNLMGLFRLQKFIQTVIVMNKALTVTVKEYRFNFFWHMWMGSNLRIGVYYTNIIKAVVPT